MADEWLTPIADEPNVSRLDRGVPHIARVYDYCLGGKDNFAADREAAEEFVKVMPGIIPTVRECRKFLARAVSFLAADCGIRQFLDIGTGLPTADNTHEVAQRTEPSCKIVYVDYDPMVLAHARALLTSSAEGETAYIDADLRNVPTILEKASSTLDFSQPVALMLLGILHCIPDSDDPYGIVRRLLDALAPGSYLVIGHPASDVETEAASRATSGLNTALAEPVTFRPRERVEAFFDGLDILPPGLVQYQQWRPDEAEPYPGQTSAWCAVARKS
ncbi:MAG: SAM-dependent methyltransferase [Streptosporangiaceae bacterium]|jgi:SAM-dependent methyltransferase